MKVIRPKRKILILNNLICCYFGSFAKSDIFLRILPMKCLKYCTSFYRRPGFGPKAAPMGALIYSCPKALPLMPYIPPHLQNILYRPLVAVRPPSTPKVVKEDPAVKEESVASPTKDWNTELRTLEAVASNLEMADESVLDDLEEKLLLFETVNMVPSR